MLSFFIGWLKYMLILIEENWDAEDPMPISRNEVDTKNEKGIIKTLVDWIFDREDDE